MLTSPTTSRFRGTITGIGSSSGVRLVIGDWAESPLGAFTDVMVADATGRRILLAPTTEVGDFVAGTYTFDDVRVGPVRAVAVSDGWRVSGPDLAVWYQVGERLPLGRLLRLVPRRVATSAGWTRVTDPCARLLLTGVRTRGTAGQGRQECYGATDLHAVTAVTGRWVGRAIGDLRPVLPDPHFGFGSTPARPAVTSLVTTVIG